MDNAISGKDEKLSEKEDKPLKVSEKNVADSYNDFNSKLKKSIEKKCPDKNESFSGNDEEELEFLLSLKEPVHTSPVNINKNFETG